MEELWKFRTPSTTVRVVTIIYPFCWLPPQTDNRFRVQLLIRIIATSENIDSFVYSLLLRCSTNSQQQQHSDPFRLFLLRCGNRHLYVCLLIQLTSSTLARVKYPIGDGLFCALVSILEGLPGTVSQAPPTSRHRKDFCRRGNRISRESTNKSSGFRLLEGNRFWAGPRKTEEQRSRTGRAINIKIIGCMIIIMMIVCRIRIGFKCALLN